MGNFKSNLDGINLRALDFDELYKRAVLQDDITKLSVMNINFKSGLLSSGSEQEVWNSTGDLIFPDDAETIDIVSTSADDSVAGTGIQQFRIIGLDANFENVIELVNSNGLTPVTSTTQYIHVRRVETALSGSTKSNVGTITATGTDTSNVYGVIDPTEGITVNSHFVIPAGFTAYLTNLMISITVPDATTIREAEVIMKQTYGIRETANAYKYSIGLVGTRGNGTLYIPGLFQSWNTPENTKTTIVVKPSGNNTIVSGNLQVLLVKEDNPFLYP